MKILIFLFFCHAGPSLEVIEDDVNLISFFKEPDEMILGMADDDDTIWTDSETDDPRMILDDDDDDDDEDDLNGP